MYAFTPLGNTVSVSVSTASANKQVKAAVGNAGKIRVANDGSATIFVKFGDSDVVATAADIPILAGTSEVFAGMRNSYVAAILATGTGTLYATPGE